VAARSKFFDLHAALKSPVEQRELEQIGHANKIQRWLKALGVDERQRQRQEYSKPLFDALQALGHRPAR
jgi:hypothetical protein